MPTGRLLSNGGMRSLNVFLTCMPSLFCLLCALHTHEGDMDLGKSLAQLLFGARCPHILPECEWPWATTPPGLCLGSAERSKDTGLRLHLLCSPTHPCPGPLLPLCRRLPAWSAPDSLPRAAPVIASVVSGLGPSCKRMPPSAFWGCLTMSVSCQHLLSPAIVWFYLS